MLTPLIVNRSAGDIVPCTLFLLFPALRSVLTLLGPQSCFGDKLLIIRVRCPHNGSAVLKGLKLAFRTEMRFRALKSTGIHYSKLKNCTACCPHTWTCTGMLPNYQDTCTDTCQFLSGCLFSRWIDSHSFKPVSARCANISTNVPIIYVCFSQMCRHLSVLFCFNVLFRHAPFQ